MPSAEAAEKTAESQRHGILAFAMQHLPQNIDILEHGGKGYRRLVNNAKWTLASLNHAERFDAKTPVILERHNATDETFVLLSGEATLLVGRNAERVPMEPLKYYNVRAGIWHHIHVSPNARVLIAESADTSIANRKRS